ncbi:L-alanine-DL-glutamate epimerase [Hydrogenimonas sp.]|nr:L-alanine-DL-glutamate epimerase [Hydrogenimonas sp.]
MRVTGFRLSYVSIPLERAFVTALRRVTAAEAVRIELIGDNGRIGIGEAPPTKAVTGEGEKEIEETIERTILPEIVNRNFDSLSEALDVLHSCCDGRSSAKAAVDIALHNLFGGADYRAEGYIEVKSAVTISLGGAEEMARDAAEAVRRGCDVLKVKLGGLDGMDIRRIEAVRNSAPEAKLLADANQAWSEREALHIMESIAPFGIELVEQPLPASDLDGMRRVAAAGVLPVLADETVFTLEDAKRVMESAAADMINIKLMKCGGVSKAVEILKWCEANGVECMLGSMLETPVSIEAAVRVAACFRNCIRFIDLDSPLLYKRVPEDSAIRVENSVLKLETR